MVTKLVSVMLDLAREMLPLGGNEWDTLSLAYNRKIGNIMPRGVPRNGDALRRKFKSLKNVKKPTGDPNIPAEVKDAKHIQWAIESKSSVQNMDDDDDGEDMEEEDDDESQWIGESQFNNNSGRQKYWHVRATFVFNADMAQYKQQRTRMLIQMRTVMLKRTQKLKTPTILFRKCPHPPPPTCPSLA